MQTASVQTLVLWNTFLDCVRQVLKSFQALEVHTPTLVKSPGTEPYLDFYMTTDRLYLPPSPEYSLKKLLSLFGISLFEIRPCFRKDLPSPWHRREFFMLEWYQVGVTESRFKELVVQFLTTLWLQFCSRCQELGYQEVIDFDFWVSKLPRARILPDLTYDVLKPLPEWFVDIKSGVHPNVSPESLVIPSIRVDQAFKTFYGFPFEAHTSFAELLDLARKVGLGCDASWTYDDVFHALMLERVEPALAGYSACFISHYPAEQAALAELDAAGWALRFELYVHGIEIGNAYQELQDPDEYRRRWFHDNEKRKSLGKEEIPWDEEFYLALKRGWPHPTCGIALGLERLFSLFLGQKNIHFWSPLFNEL